MLERFWNGIIVLSAAASLVPCAHGQAQTRIRIGHFNIRELDNKELEVSNNAQAQAAAQIIQRFAPDLLSINEMSYDIEGANGSTHTGENNQLFEDHYLSVSQAGQPTLRYPHKYFVRGNSGMASGEGFDYGFAHFRGQYNMAFYSKYPIIKGRVRRFHTFLWKDLPGNMKPKSVSDGQRLFDKDFWDIPVDVNGRVVHVLMCHAVVPVFDETNDERNFDTLRFLRDYVKGTASYATPDGGIQADDLFVIIGDLNADPDDGESKPGAVQQLLESALIHPSQPEGDGLDSDGLPPDETSYNPSGANFVRNTLKSGIGETSPGGFQLQLDYILPSKTLALAEPGEGLRTAGVFWSRLGTTAWKLQRTASDHHFLWTDLVVPGAE